MKKYLLIFALLVALFAVACNETTIPVGKTNETPLPQCGQCPQITPPGPGFCPEGRIVSAGTDSCGCVLPPKCEKIIQGGKEPTTPTGQIQEEEKTFCTQEQKQAEVCTMEYHPVCGWFSEKIKCFAYPCAQTFSNPCIACQNEDVDFWTEGECPQTGSKPAQ